MRTYRTNRGWSIWDALTQPQRLQVVEIAKTLKRTGTDG